MTKGGIDIIMKRKSRYMYLNDNRIEYEKSKNKYEELLKEASKYKENAKSIKYQIKEYEKVINDLSKKINHLNKSYDNCILMSKELNDKAIKYKNNDNRNYIYPDTMEDTHEEMMYVSSFLNEAAGYIIPMYNMGDLEKMDEFEDRYPFIDDDFEYFDNYELIK